MSNNWTSRGDGETAISKEVLDRYSPQNITDNKDLARQLREIEMNPGLGIVAKINAKRTLFKGVTQAKQMELHHHLESYENYLMARKDVEAKAISQEATRAILMLEMQYIQIMDSLGLEQNERLMDSLKKSGEMFTRKLEELSESDMLPELKVGIQQDYQAIYDKAKARIMASLDDYMNELSSKEGRRG
mgnify:CR=1 FL=1|jgi:hypothetical protein